MVVQAATGLYLCDLDIQFKEYLIEHPRSLKNILYEIKARSHDEFNESVIPFVSTSEIDDLQKWIDLSKII